MTAQCPGLHIVTQWICRFSSLIGRLGSSAFRLSTVTVLGSLAGACFSTESAQRPFHHGIRERGGTIFRAALPVAIGRSKRPSGLTSSIVPRGTPFHRWVELECSPIAIDAVPSCCRYGLSGPSKLGAVNPDAVQDHGQPARKRTHSRQIAHTGFASLAQCSVKKQGGTSGVSRPQKPAISYTPDNIITAPAATMAGLIYLSGIGGSHVPSNDGTLAM
jgi:hypothetical protein